MANLRPGDGRIGFELPGVDDQRHALTDYADKEAIAVIFTCNHCPYARAWEDRIIQIQSDYADRGVQVIAISANDPEKYPADSFPKMKERAQEKGFNFPYLFDESQEVARAYGAERTPEVYLFGKDGTLLYHGTIDDNYDDPEAVKYHFVRDALDATLDGEEPPCRRDPAYRLHYKMEVKNQQQSLSCIGQSGKNEKTKQEVSEA